VSFEYAHATTLPDALTALSAEGTFPVAGGTDLVPCVDEGILSPARVLDIRTLPGARDITLHADGSATIGAAVRISELAAHEGLRARFPVLAESAASVGTPALRNMGTIGGNLAQRHHCWYFRRGVGCFKRGGTQCAAVDGEHEYHGIVAGGVCRAVHPSDPAVALEALEATVIVARAGAAERRVSIEALYAGAADNPLREATLAHGELITAIELPAAAADGVQHWEKVMQRGAWDFALVSCAAVRRTDGTVRLALGGVALAPWRIALSVEEDIASGGLDDDSIDALAERAMYDVEPLARNGYKVTLAQTVLKRAMQALG
jgi:xanthine dehydrogenase YagS FAD-binding subunit